MKVTRVKNLMISGLSVITNNTLEFESENGKIPQLWNDYIEKNVYGNTFNKTKSQYMYGVYSDYTSDATGDYVVTVGVEVSKPKNAIVIEDERYLVFSKKGELPDVVVELWEEIWNYFEGNSEYERAFSVDFEKYTKEDEIEIFISIL
ncbi:MAG: GyrI-like domain-containing protein [Candidatus Marinarcus sp.]|uniref:GyrI-like domain-containing protein n=1 Tax=Candidatus Marinarcus sp. TaxID=3100987 RepID=UPI003AFF69B2